MLTTSDNRTSKQVSLAEAQRRKKRRSDLLHISVHSALIMCCVLALFPLLWTFITSITPRELVYQWPPQFIPDNITFDAYARALGKTDLPRNFLNSLLVTTATVLGSLLIGSMAAFRFARGTFPGKNIILLFFIATIMVPGLSNIIPLYIIMRELSLLNTYLSLILVYIAGAMPLTVWLLKGFIESIPKELDESALLDGASKFQVFRFVILPLIGPGMAAAAVITFINSWNEFLLALTFIQSPEKRTLQPGIQLFVGYYESTEWTLIAAATLIACIPVIILFIFLQRSLIAGLTAGAVKG
ncbi:MAG: carbohydrate ABC transporter permease [Deinococcota bacterium]